MQFIGNLELPELKKFTRFVHAGDRVFLAGDSGETMFLVVTGIVGLYDQKNGKERLVGTIGSGQVFGEQAIIAREPYHRAFSAEAIIDSRLIEAGINDIREIEKYVPDFTLRILQITVKWTSRTNRLLKVLRPLDKTERLIRCLEFLTEEKGAQAKVDPEELHYLTNVEIDDIQKALNWMTTQGYVARGILKGASEIRSRIDELKSALD